MSKLNFKILFYVMNEFYHEWDEPAAVCLVAAVPALLCRGQQLRSASLSPLPVSSEQERHARPAVSCLSWAQLLSPGSLVHIQLSCPVLRLRRGSSSVSPPRRGRAVPGAALSDLSAALSGCVASLAAPASAALLLLFLWSETLSVSWETHECVSGRHPSGAGRPVPLPAGLHIFSRWVTQVPGRQTVSLEGGRQTAWRQADRQTDSLETGRQADRQAACLTWTGVGHCVLVKSEEHRWLRKTEQ